MSGFIYHGDPRADCLFPTAIDHVAIRCASDGVLDKAKTHKYTKLFSHKLVQGFCTVSQDLGGSGFPENSLVPLGREQYGVELKRQAVHK